MNYYTEDVQFIDGLPKTTKNTESELHGYGTKSIQLIAEKYSGNASFNLNENVFNYTILLLNLESEKEESDTVGFTEA